MKQLWLSILQKLSRQKGAGLLDAIVAVGVVGTTFAVLLSGLASSTGAVGNKDSYITAQSIARNQLESVHNEPYVPPPTTYPSVTTPAGYSVTADAVSIDPDPNVEKVVVTVYKAGTVELVVESIKTNR